MSDNNQKFAKAIADLAKRAVDSARTPTEEEYNQRFTRWARQLQILLAKLPEQDVMSNGFTFTHLLGMAIGLGIVSTEEGNEILRDILKATLN